MFSCVCAVLSRFRHLLQLELDTNDKISSVSVGWQHTDNGLGWVGRATPIGLSRNVKEEF